MKTTRVALVHQFFPLYRLGIVKAMLDHPQLDCSFYADTSDSMDQDPTHKRAYGGIAHIPTEVYRGKLVVTRMKYFKSLMVQSHMVRLALDPKVKHIIYLADMHYVSTWIGGALARLMGKKVHFWTIGWHADRTGLIDKGRIAFYRIASTLMMYGQYGKDMALKRGFDPKRVFVINNSLDYDSQMVIRQQAPQSLEALGVKFSKEGPTIICVSRLTGKRRLDLMLKAVAHLKNNGLEVNTLIVGDGPERTMVETTVQDLGLQEQVVLYGACYQEELVARMIENCVATVAPGMVGLTATQSLMYGTPVITHNNPHAQSPEYEAIIDGYNGSLFEENNVEALAHAIQFWIEERQRIGLEALRQQCYKQVDEVFNPAAQLRLMMQAMNIG